MLGAAGALVGGQRRRYASRRVLIVRIIERETMTMFSKTVVAVALAVVTSQALGAIDNRSGVESSGSIADISNETGIGGQNNATVSFDGGVGMLMSETLIDDALTPDFNGNGPWDRGLSHARGAIDLASGNPAALRAKSILTGNSSNVRNHATAHVGVFSSEKFQYVGSAPTTLSITWTLTGKVHEVDNGDDYSNGFTGIFANVAVFCDTPEYDFYGHIPTLVSELGAMLKQHDGVDAVDQSLDIADDTAGQVAQVMTTLQFDVEPGETFYVHQTLDTSAYRLDRSADSFSTLTAVFGQPSLVRNVVPEPASVALLGIGALLLASRRR